MFSYCENNPVNNSDPNGNRWIALALQRLIHNEVANRVAMAIHGWHNVYVKKEVHRDNKTEVKRGFLDVYDPIENSYYEVKSNTTAYSNRTKRQMEKYDGSELGYNGRGPISRGTQHPSGSFNYGIYDVSYTTPESGLVTYEAKINPNRAVAAVGTIAVCMAMGAFGTAIGVGGLARAITIF